MTMTESNFCGVSPKMARISYAGICLLLLYMLTVLIIKVDTKGLTELKRQKREWIIPPRKLKENVDYRSTIIAKIRSDEEVRTSIRYSLTGQGADQDPFGLFIVDSRTGEVRVTDILDREKRAFYNLQGVAKFQNGSRAERNIELRINVEDENDNFPIFSIVEAGSVTELSQSGTFVMRMTATDADDPLTPNAQIAYRVLQQIPGDTAMFYVNTETGEIHVHQNTLDRETHASYTLKVIGTDMNGGKGGRTGTGTVVINILDVNDNVPTLEKSHYEASVEENTVNVEVMRMKAVDMDLMYTESWLAVFSIVSGNEAGYFSITTDEKTNEGVVTLIKALDYEELKEINLRVAMENRAAYHSSVTVVSGGTSYPVKIKVKNQPEGPRFSPVMKAISISENSKVVSTHTVIATYAAIDGDTLVAAENVRYAKVHDPANWLIIDGKTAEIKLSQIPDRESKYLINGTYIAKIICITNDIPAKTATGTIFMEVEDFNDHCPILTSTTETLCSHETGLLVSAEDADGNPNGPPFLFHVIPKETKQEWTVEPNNDTSVILRANEHLWPGLYQVEVEVRDQQGKACDDLQPFSGPRGSGSCCWRCCCFYWYPFCCCSVRVGGKDFTAIPFDTKEHLIEYHTERPGEDKEVPLLQIPTEVDGSIQMKNVDRFGTGQTVGGVAGGGMHTGARNRYSRYEGFSKGAWDGLALTEDYLNEYYSQKANCAESLAAQLKDGLQIYEYEGQESPVGSVGCCSFIDADDNLDFLNDLGPKFKTLADICMGSAIETVSSTDTSAADVRFGGMSSSSSTMTRTEIAAETTLTASKAPAAHVGESVFTETSYATSATSVPRVHVTENVLASNMAYVIQPAPMFYAAAPVLPTTRYILEPPPLGATLLVAERPGSAQGVYLLNDAPHTVSMNESVVLVEQHHVLREADVGRGPHPPACGESWARVVTESQSGHQQVLQQGTSPSGSQNLLLAVSTGSTEGGRSPASRNSPAGEEGASWLSGSQEEMVVLQTAATAGTHTVVMQEKQVSFSERSVQQVITSADQVPI
ncbi:hypothetical protein SKAU_G00380330 [Synaphobranchus kaupii]|uniref:Cadherin domain-containing protein n=1 Tax=Synaphobranchus kaupii TaxID=118154 RepID=A0A9Q1EDL7_SYNKA|nr:hypothetical protein SKAU_G00380330 [Synaphobranchus kaupii]